MSKTLEELRVDLARFLGMLFTGTAEAGSDRWIIDVGGLAQYTEADSLNGSLAYIRTAAGAAPEDESGWIEDYIATPHPNAAEIIGNGGFETAGAGGADVFASWTEQADGGAIERQAGNFEGSFKCYMLSIGGSTGIKQLLTVTENTAYRLIINHYSTVGKPGYYSIRDNTNGAWIVASADGKLTGYDTLDWETFILDFVTPENCTELEFWLWANDHAAPGATYFDGISLQLVGGIYLSEALTAEVGPADVYEVYTIPLTLEQWNTAINQAINAGWPQVFSREMWQTASAEVSKYLLPDGMGDVMEVDVAFKGYYAGMPTQTVPRSGWRVEGTPGTDLHLHLHNIVPAEGRDLHIYCKGKHPELATGESSEIDHEYLMLAAAARLYQILGSQAGAEVVSNRYLQLFNYYAEKAQERRDLLEAEAWAIPPEARKEGEKGRRR